VSRPLPLHFRSFLIPALAALLLFSGCSKKTEPNNSKQAGRQNQENVAEVIAVQQREGSAPNFSWKDSMGNVIDLDNFRGKVTLVNFWATWCGPCKRELPDLISLNAELADRGVKVIGVSTDRGSNAVEDVRSFAKEHSITYQIVISNDDLEKAFGNVNFLPTSFIVDANGKIVQTYVGPRSKSFFSDALLATLK
jgi:peroxiredoxin